VGFFDSFNLSLLEEAIAEPSKLNFLNDIPPDDFVLCRDAVGNPTAVYGADEWDLNPLRLSAKRLSIFRFNIFKDKVDLEAQRYLIAQSKYIVFCLMYYVDSGRLGRLNVSTVYNLFGIVRTMALYCYEQRNRDLVGVLSFKQLLATPVYLADFLKVSDLSDARKKFCRQLICNLQALGESYLGYRVVSVEELDVEFGESSQHPVIPTRIYLGVLNGLSDFVERIYPFMPRFERFLAEFLDKNYGLTHHVQKTYGVPRCDWRPTMDEAISAYKLGGLFSGELACTHRRGLLRVICIIQYVVKCVIHAYTGMRDQEVMRLPYDCIAQAEVMPSLVDGQGVIRDKARMIDLISTTTKFAGYRSEASWLATSEVVRVVEIARHICRGLSVFFESGTQDLPLFLNPSVFNYKEISVRVSDLTKDRKPDFLSNILIEEGDLSELMASSNNHDYGEDFAIGQPWKLTSHQFRRSLAYYGSNSGFISLPSLKRQFKHLTLQMARYYSNNFERLKTIFGFYDPAVGDFVLPSTHVAFEFQLAMPISVAYDLLTQVFESPSTLIGGAGSYINKQRERLSADGILIAEVRADTEKRVRDGQVYYTRTFLGGCTFVGECDSYMLGDFISCTSCPDSIIKPELVGKAIELTAEQLAQYEVGSGEYQVTKADLDCLTDFANRRIHAVEVV